MQDDAVEIMARLLTAYLDASGVSSGCVYGMPDLPDGDMWLSAKIAAQLAEVDVQVIGTWTSRARRGELRWENPWPAGIRVEGRNYYRASEVIAWIEGNQERHR
jgi:hypothetical protein